MKKQTKFIVIGVLVLIVGLFAWGRFSDSNRALIKNWESYGVGCLPNGHQNLAQHIHAAVQISVDGKLEIIPTNVGVVSTCMAELHTHETDGVIHIESVSADARFTLGQFFQMLDKELSRPGYALTMTVGGEPSTEFENLILTDLQQIALEYTPIAETVNQ